MAEQLAFLSRYRSVVDDFDSFIDAAGAPLPRTFWHNHLRCPETVMHQWIGSGIEPVPGISGAYRVADVDGTRFRAAYLAGLIHIQEAASMIPVQLLKVSAGSDVLDLCAAPGNKSAQAAVRVGGDGTVIANDISRARAGIIQTTLDRLSLTNVAVTISDAARFPVSAALFEHVIADVPCSCEGTTRKNPGVLSGTKPGYRDKLVLRQRRILERALSLCRPGGQVVYATCTYAPEENESVVSDVLLHSAIGQDFELVDVTEGSPFFSPGLQTWMGETFHEDIKRTGRIWPHVQDTGGFFVALLKRKGRTQARPAENRTESGSIPEFGAPPADIESDARWFGLSPSVLRQYKYVQISTKYRSIVDRSLYVPESPRPVAVGVRGVNTKGNSHRISTAGVRLLGLGSKRQRIHIHPDDVGAYFQGDSVTPLHADDTFPGKVIVISDDILLGFGNLVTSGDAMVLESIFPVSFGGIDTRSDV